MSDLQLKISNNKAHFKEPLKVESKLSESEKGRLKKTAKEFESMLTSMMLKSMTKTTDGLFGKDNYGGDVLDVLFENEIAKMMTESQGMGIANKIYKSLAGEELNSANIKNVISAAKKDIAAKPNEVLKKVKTSSITPSANAMDRLQRFENIIHEAAEKFNVDKKLIKSVILTESAAKPNAISRVNAKGLMQLMDSTATELGVENSLDPTENIFGGTKYLSQLLDLYEGNKDKALAAYNAGMGNVKKYNGIPPFKETQNYIKRVNNYLNILD